MYDSDDMYAMHDGIDVSDTAFFPLPLAAALVLRPLRPRGLLISGHGWGSGFGPAPTINATTNTAISLRTHSNLHTVNTIISAACLPAHPL